MKTYEEFLELLDDEETVVPVLRGTTDERIRPSADNNPCEVCSVAEYNKQCTAAPKCAALMFHTFAKMPRMTRDFFAKEEPE